jgi:regulator of sigma E protease
MVLVMVHELGHYFAAKKCGMRVERFSIFFGPAIAKWQRGETEWRLGTIPLGGYVKITGMTREEKVPEELVGRTYYAAPFWKRFVTIFAGPAVNIVLAFIVFAGYYWIGPQGQVPINRIESVAAGKPAAKIGLVKGDKIVSINGVTATNDDIVPLQRELQRNPAKPVTVVFEHAGTRVTKEVTLTSVTFEGKRIGQLGFVFSTKLIGRQHSTFFGGLRDASSFSWYWTKLQVQGLGQMFTSQEARDQTSSIVGIGAAYDIVAEDGLMSVLRFFGLISLVLGVFNLLPILPLDGGHILFAAIEKVRGKHLSRRAYEMSAVFGLVLLGLLFVQGLTNDVTRLTGEGFRPR